MIFENVWELCCCYKTNFLQKKVNGSYLCAVALVFLKQNDLQIVEL